jgi:hypothetical protein
MTVANRSASLSTHSVALSEAAPGDVAQHPDEATRAALWAHLDEVLKSPCFSTSRRSQEFLRYIVREAIEGRGNAIKERNIAHEVFGRGINFEPGEDSLVRVKAREVRKRLTDYYNSAPASPFVIELPLGGYFPRIHVPGQMPAFVQSGPGDGSDKTKPFNRRKFAWMLGGTLGVAGAASIVPLARLHRSPLDLLWKPIFATKTPLLVFIPILTERANGILSDRVGIGPAAALRRAADFLTKHDYPYHLRFGADLTFAQLREQPSLILGGFSSIWTLSLMRDLRFTFVDRQGPDTQSLSVQGLVSGQVLIDRQTNRTWEAVNPKPNGYADQDYGILCRLFDAASGQIVLLAGGLTTFGTEAAASIFFDPAAFAEVVKQAPDDWTTKNLQAVIRTSIIGTTPSTPQIVTTHFW